MFSLNKILSSMKVHKCISIPCRSYKTVRVCVGSKYVVERLLSLSYSDYCHTSKFYIHMYVYVFI